MFRWLLAVAVLATVMAEPADDKIPLLPGYPATFNNRAYGGYLDTSSPTRSLHYIFMEANAGTKNTAPVVLWLNGGPGCTSMLGFLQEISPYVLSENQTYNAGDDLTYNPHNWLTVANLLFIDAPAGTGYSINLDPKEKYEYNDENTARDNM
jgi:carboxypeptidase C (cathepsin A)